MTLLTVVQDVCATVGVAIPQSSIFSNISNNRTMQEMLSLANEMAQRIAYDTRDWTLLKAVSTMAGDGSKTAFPLPTDYKRMLLTANVWRSTNNVTPMRFVPDTDEWLQRRAMNIYDAYGEWTMMGGQMLIFPAMGASVTAYFAYLSKNCIALAGGGLGTAFMADGDSFRLDERSFKLGMIWQWKAQKGAPYNEDLGTYGDALTNAMGRDSPAPILIGRKPLAVAARTAYPFPVPTP
jgi:hypothetical protein